MKKIPYGKHHITPEDIEAVTSVLQQEFFLTQGPKIPEFEKKFASYVGAKYAVVVSNGTAALHLSAIALGVNDQSRVITTPITFAASANCVRYCGGSIEFCDIDKETLVLDISKVREKLEAAPKGTYDGIIPVDFAGYPVNLEAFRELADEYDLWILEDACHAPGGSFLDSTGKKQHCGNGEFADLAIFSFHPVKHIASGEGGMITTNNEDHYQKLLQLRSHGMVYQGNSHALQENHGKWYMEMQELGYNYRLPDILCALGISQLERADAGVKKRKEIASRYDLAFKGTLVKFHKPASGFDHAYHLYVIEVQNRKELYNILRDHGILVQVHYIPLHTMPYYKARGNKKGDMPVAEAYYEKCISLPMFPGLTDDEQGFVINTVLKHAK